MTFYVTSPGGRMSRLASVTAVLSFQIVKKLVSGGLMSKRNTLCYRTWTDG
jgi:hypothetical protein